MSTYTPMTPAAFLALIEIDTHLNAEIEDSVLLQLHDRELIEESYNDPCCWINYDTSVALTNKGSAFLDSVYSTPMPVLVNSGWEVPKG